MRSPPLGNPILVFMLLHHNVHHTLEWERTKDHTWIYEGRLYMENY